MAKRRPRERGSISGAFAWRLIEMLESPANRVMSLSAKPILERLEIELHHHGGKPEENGRLACTFDHFAEFGIDRHAIAPAIREAVALGFVQITRPGCAGNANYRQPTLWPPTNPVEMGLPDIACAVYRASQRPYRALFEMVWGKQAFAIEWPNEVERVCNLPAPPPAGDPTPVHLEQVDRGRAAATFDQMAQSIAGYEASAEATTFTSKYDAVLAGKAQFTSQEQLGYDLFRGKARCNSCHRDGGPGEEPMFTDFTASNIGTPPNPLLPFYAENRPDALGYAANPDGASFVDGGVGRFLLQRHLLSQPSEVDGRWVPLAPHNEGRFRVPTLRNVDKRPNPSFVKAYAHNGYFKSLKAIVHFYNTRDVLPRCQTNDPGENASCWPAPETTANMNTSKVGRLGLTDAEEDALVSFMQTLTDGFITR